jgi:hypothetical protein
MQNQPGTNSNVALTEWINCFRIVGEYAKWHVNSNIFDIRIYIRL